VRKDREEITKRIRGLDMSNSKSKATRSHGIQPVSGLFFDSSQVMELGYEI
jgi:hypothetical protein